MRDTSLYKDVNQFTPTSREYSLDAQAVYQAVMNLIRIFFMEVPFTTYGVNLEEYLFELYNDSDATDIMYRLTASIEDVEKRVRIDTESSGIEFDADRQVLKVNFYFEIEGIEGQQFQILEDINMDR